MTVKSNPEQKTYFRQQSKLATIARDQTHTVISEQRASVSVNIG